MPRLLNIKYVMTRHPVTVNSQMQIEKAVKLMRKSGVSSLTIEENKIIKGILTEGDIIEKALLKNLDIKKNNVEKIMQRKVITIHESADIMKAMSTMAEHDLRRLPVVDDNNSLIGLVTIKDMLQVQPELLNIVIEKGKLGLRR